MDSFQWPFCARFPPKMRGGTQFWDARRALRPIEATSYEIDAEATQMQQVGGESVMLSLSRAAPKYCFPR